MTTMTNNGTEKDEAIAAVLHYLRKMGYRQTEKLLKEEAHVNDIETMAFELRNEQDSNITNYLLFAGSGNLDYSFYEEAYEGLRKWTCESLDAFRDELTPVLFPLFIHCYLDIIAKGGANEAKSFLEKYKSEHLNRHEDEIIKLSTITEAGHLRENSLAVAFRTNKYNLIMSAYSFQLLMNYLQDSTARANVILLKIINQFINIRVLVSKLNNASTMSGNAAVGLTGASIETVSSVNAGKIQWGVHPVEPAVDLALQQRAKVENRLNEILQGPLIQLKRLYAQTSLNAPLTDRIPKPIPTAAETSAEIDRLRNLVRKAHLSSTQLPSICFYTLHNSYGGVTAVEFSPNATLMASGNRDSYIDIWSLNHEPLRAIRPSTELAAMDLADFESLEPMREFDGSLSKRLIGHSGPVYACKFLHPNEQRFMISVSQDGTARLWSLDLFSCVVVYRGHNLPVWDVDVAPLGAGPYFVTGSADRTARLWSTEHVQPLRIFAGHISDVDVVKFHPNGNYVITGSSDKTCRMWDIQNGACVRLFSGHARGISSLIISPDGRHLISADQGGLVKVWDLADGRHIKNIQLKPVTTSKGSRKNVALTPYSMDIDRDGKLLAIAGADQMVRIFNLASLVLPSNEQSDPLPLATFPTKQTFIFRLYFTYRNVLLGTGPFMTEE